MLAQADFVARSIERIQEGCGANVDDITITTNDDTAIEVSDDILADEGLSF